MVIGEAPGATEDEQGLPFVGQAGEVLDSIFEEAGVEREELYIHNVLSCRPPDNSFPDGEEPPDICKRWPLAEIEAIRPAVVVLLGKRATEHILGETGTLKSKIGEFKTLVTPNGYECQAVVMYHPSYLLRRGEGVGDENFDKAVSVWADIKSKLPALVDDTEGQEFSVVDIQEFFGRELGWISDPVIRKWCVKAWLAAPDYAYTAPASMSGKYHPAFALGERGLVRHTRAVAYAVHRWCGRIGCSAVETDCMVAAALMHDVVKYGDTYGDRSDRSYKQYQRHASISADHVATHRPPGVDDDAAACVESLVRTHMGQWGSTPPSSKWEKLLHLADMLTSSRELCLDIFTELDFAEEADKKAAMLPPREIDVTIARKATPEWFRDTFGSDLTGLSDDLRNWLQRLWGRVGNVSVWDVLLAKKLYMLVDRILDILPDKMHPALRGAALAQPQHDKIVAEDRQQDGIVHDVVGTVMDVDSVDYGELSFYPPQRLLFLLYVLASDPAWDYRIDEGVFG
jgi:DNA polymerase